MTTLQTNFSQISNLNLIELDRYEMEEIDGGFPWVHYTLVLGAVYLTYEVGYAIGGGIYHMTH